METLTYLFMAIVLLAAVLASIAAWAPRRAWVRFSALGVTLLIVPLGFLQVTELLSRPKPAKYEWLRRNVDKVTVLSVSFDEGRAIYLWLRLDGDVRPRYYSLPWHNKLAEQIEEALEESVAQSGDLVLRDFFSKETYEELGKLNLEIVPPPLPPQKPPYAAPPKIPDPREKGV